MIHVNATAHPSAAWTLQQLREAIPSDHTYRFILHDHDAIFSLDSMSLSPVSALKSSRPRFTARRPMRCAKG